MKLCFVECGYTTLIISMHAIVLLLIGKVECFSSIGRTFRLTQNTPTPTDIRSRIRNGHEIADPVRVDTVCRVNTFYGDEEDDYNKDDDDDIELEKYQIDASLMDNKKSIGGAQQQPVSDTQLQIEQQQKQIDMLMQMVKNQPQMQQQSQQPEQQSPVQSSQSGGQPFGEPLSNTDDMLPPPLPGMFEEEGEEELLDYQNAPPTAQMGSTSESPSSMVGFNARGGVVPVAPLKAMLFIDGTWLYYSLYRRKEEQDPIVKKFGKGWPFRYRFDWNALPRIICEQIVGQQRDLGWSSTGVDDNSLQNGAVRPVEIVRASVFTSYKKTTDPKSFRAKMYNEMADANYDIHMLESTSNGPEKCVDISLAVEMLHYATVPNAYDVAILLSGDKDFIPAMVRTRQKGRKVGVVSMKTGCNRALHEGSHIKDFDVVWIDDFLDRLLVPLPPDQMGKNAQRVYDRGMLSAFTITKVILDFASQSPYGKVSSRDVGRYLKNLELPGGTSLLDDVKIGQGGLRRFMQDRMPMAFEVTDRTKFQSRDPNDKSYWIAKKDGATNVLLEEAKRTKFTTEEKSFLEDYQSGAIDRGAEEDIFYYTAEVLEKEDISNTQKGGFNIFPSESTQHTKASVDHSSWTVIRLKDLCREKGLPVSGTKAALIERIEKAEEEDSKKLPTEATNATSELSDKEKLEKYLIDLVKYYIQESRGYASSRDLGRFLSTNSASNSDSNSALQELKNSFGGVAAFLNERNNIFTTVRESSDGDPMNFSFGIKLKDSGNVPIAAPDVPISRSSPTNTNTPRTGSNHAQNVHPEITAHIEALLREYLYASGGEASSRNIGRYLSANAALEPAGSSGGGDRRNTALKQLKSNYGSLAFYLTTKEDTFVKVESGFQGGQGEMDPPSGHSFGVRLK